MAIEESLGFSRDDVLRQADSLERRLRRINELRQMHDKADANGDMPDLELLLLLLRRSTRSDDPETLCLSLTCLLLTDWLASKYETTLFDRLQSLE